MSNQINNAEDIMMQTLARLNNTELDGEALKSEIERSTAIAKVADQIMKSNLLKLKALEMVNKGTLGQRQVKEVFSLSSGNQE